MQPMPSKPPFTLTGFDHIVFLVDDMPRATGLLPRRAGLRAGLQLSCAGDGAALVRRCLIVLWDTTQPGAASAIPPIAGGRNVDHLCIATSPFAPQALRDHLAAHGVAIEREAIHGGARGMGHSVYIHDPFGNKLETQRPRRLPRRAIRLKSSPGFRHPLCKNILGGRPDCRRQSGRGAERPPNTSAILRAPR